MIQLQVPEFFIVHDDPVSIGPVKGCSFHCATWAGGSPSPFPEHRARSEGRAVSEREFRELLQAIRLGW